MQFLIRKSDGRLINVRRNPATMVTNEAFDPELYSVVLYKGDAVPTLYQDPLQWLFDVKAQKLTFSPLEDEADRAAMTALRAKINQLVELRKVIRGQHSVMCAGYPGDAVVSTAKFLEATGLLGAVTPLLSAEAARTGKTLEEVKIAAIAERVEFHTQLAAVEEFRHTTADAVLKATTRAEAVAVVKVASKQHRDEVRAAHLARAHQRAQKPA